MIELTEQTIIEQLAQRLARRFPTLSGETIMQVVRQHHARFDGSRIRDFIPLFVERGAKADLGRLST